MAKNGCLSVRKIGNYRVISGSVKVALLAQVDRWQRLSISLE
jgi:hypothetical protein